MERRVAHFKNIRNALTDKTSKNYVRDRIGFGQHESASVEDEEWYGILPDAE